MANTRNPNAKSARLFDPEGAPVQSTEDVPLMQTATGQWPPRLYQGEKTYNFDAMLTMSNEGNPCYREFIPPTGGLVLPFLPKLFDAEGNPLNKRAQPIERATNTPDAAFPKELTVDNQLYAFDEELSRTNNVLAYRHAPKPKSRTEAEGST
jgi:hypothetical protein